MKIGLAPAEVDPFADPASVTTMAEEAEGRGYDELWVLDRPLGPVESVGPRTADGALPAKQRTALSKVESRR